jgi:hypothetical protein
MRRLAFMLALGALAFAACGETRSPLGEECLRDDDCLSSTCSARTCVAAPSLVTGAQGSPPDETPRIPNADAATLDSGPKDAGDGG